ncbi:MAG TPA: hypothetical protein PKE12_13215 [Kiritimatiellia bacterium]|nr:hypothetical protein [Kiritimatiellia bacterium]
MLHAISRWALARIFLPLLALCVFAHSPRATAAPIPYTGDGSDLQAFIDAAPERAVISCDPGVELVLDGSIHIAQTLTLRGLRARLPDGLGRTPLLVVTADDAVLEDLVLSGNHPTVPQDERSPILLIHGSRFRVERCRFSDSTKDGVLVTPANGVEIDGGVVRDIAAFRMGRDAVSIAGDNRGARVRNVRIERVRLLGGFRRGALEISDGTENISARDIYAEDAVYAVDVQDHGGASAPNRNILLEDIAAVDCRHLIRTLNTPRDHANLTLRRGSAIRCLRPLAISNTDNVRIEAVRVVAKPGVSESPIQLQACRNVLVRGIYLEGFARAPAAVAAKQCRNVVVEDVRTAPVGRAR